MKRLINYLKLSPLYELIFPFVQKQEVRTWEQSNRTTVTPQLVKQQLVKKLAEKNSLQIFIETGTYLGAMIAANKCLFKKIYTVEIDPRLYQRAKSKFSNDQHIQVILGDSSVVLPKVLKKLKQPALFWLDAHYSAGITSQGLLETPIIAEIKQILRHPIKNHLILIDDARNFNGTHDYPTIKQLRQLLYKLNPQLKLTIKQRVIQIH